MKRLFLLLLVIGFGLLGCATTVADEGSHEEEQAITVTTLDEFRYDPATIEVVAGRPVELTLVNEGALDHDFSIAAIPLAGEVESHAEGSHVEDSHAEEEAHDEEEQAHEHEMTVDPEDLMVHISAEPDDSATIVFTPSEPGEYEILCTVPGHREAGMVATLVVMAP